MSFTLIELLGGERVFRHRFTLIELLVVIVIISILAAMLLPALTRAREKGRQAYCMNNAKQAAVVLILWTDDSDGDLPSVNVAPDPQYLRGTSFEFYQRYMADEYSGGKYGFLLCPSSRAQFKPDNIWFYGYYAQMSITGFEDYKHRFPFYNESYGRGHWKAAAGDQIKAHRVPGPEHKILWMDGVDFEYSNWGTCGAAVNHTYYDRDYLRHTGGVNTVMLDGHGEWHKDADLGVGDSEYQHKVKRYWFDYIHED